MAEYQMQSSLLLKKQLAGESSVVLEVIRESWSIVCASREVSSSDVFREISIKKVEFYGLAL